MPRGGKRENAGRPAGSTNKLTAKLKATLTEMALDHTLPALQVILDVMADPDTPPAARLAAAGTILDRGHGKAFQPLTGKDGDALIPEPESMSEVARQIAFILGAATRSEKS